jgi:hypothetical protein
MPERESEPKRLRVATKRIELLEQMKLHFPRKFAGAFDAAAQARTIRTHAARLFVVSPLGTCVMPFAGKNAPARCPPPAPQHRALSTRRR